MKAACKIATAIIALAAVAKASQRNSVIREFLPFGCETPGHGSCVVCKDL